MSSWLRRVAGVRLSRLSAYAIVVEMGSLTCFAVGPALLIVGLNTVTRLGKTPGEILAGVIASSSLAMSFVVLGLVLSLANRCSSAKAEMKSSEM